MSKVLSEVRNGLVRVAIAYTGSFEQADKKFTISAADLEQMRINLGTREAPVDYEHFSAWSSPPGFSKAAGWLKSADPVEDFSDGRKALWGWAEFTPAMLAQIQQKEYRYFSPEIHWASTDEKGKSIGTKLAAGAITNRPFLKDLPPIEINAADYPGLLETVALSESKRLIDVASVHVNRDVNKKEKTMKTLKFKKLTDGEHKGKHGVFDGDDMVGLCDDAALTAYYSEAHPPEPKKEDTDEEKKAKQLSEARRADTICLVEFAKATPAESVTLAEKFVDEGKLSMIGFLKAQKIGRVVDEAIKAGKALPKQRTALYQMAIADFDSAVAYLTEAKPVIDLVTRGIAGSNRTEDGGEAKAELNTKVTAYMSEKKVGYADALRDVTRMHPDLWERSKAESARVADRS